MNNTSEQLLDLLRELGLSNNEAQIYLAALALGLSRITGLASRAGLKRTTAYSVVESLKSKGLIAEHITGFKKSYSASSPEMLEVLHAAKLDRLRHAIPLFQNLKSEEEGVRSVLYLEGADAVKSIYEELMAAAKPKDFYYAISDVEKWRNMDPAYCDEFIRRRVKKKLNLRFLFTHTLEAARRKKLEGTLSEHVRFLPPSYTLNANLVITPKRIVMHQLTSPVLAVSFESRTFIEIHKSMFELLWDSMAE